MPPDEDLEKLVRVIALRNAIEHGGKAQLDAVMSKFVASRPDRRANLKDLIPEISSIIQQVNALALADQISHVKGLEPDREYNRKRTAEPGPHLPPLENAVSGKVVTRFPPEPNGFPHIGHAKAAIIDEEYARMYDGKLILRFDDTNPNNEKIEYYDAIMEGLEWLGVRPDLIKNTSDDIETLHSLGMKMVEVGAAYVCTCPQETIHDLRAKGLACACRDDPLGLDLMKKMFEGALEENEAIIRFKGDMTDLNTAMRDPTLFRIIEGKHPRLGSRIRVWPTYDFAAPIEDSLDGVTHAMRTKEYELRNELYFAILDILDMRKPNLTEFSRLEFEGIPVSKRKIKPLIENGSVSGWDDPRLPTLSAFRRRGFTPQGIRRFVLSLGITLAETKPPFEALESFNRKIIDPTSPRLFFADDPFEIQIDGDAEFRAELKNHPTNTDLGHRTVLVSGSVFVSGNDAKGLSEGDLVRLIELYNISIISIDIPVKKIHAELAGQDIVRSMPKIQWVAKNDIVDFSVLTPKQLYNGDRYNTQSLIIAKGYSESYIQKLGIGAIVQFVRFGFCRIDKQGTAIFAHR